MLAVAAFLERRRAHSRRRCSLAAAAVHPTTAVWFAVWLGVAAWFAPAGVAQGAGRCCAALLVAAAALALWRGPLAGRLTRMDAEWLAVIADRDYLFPLAWPMDAWVTNLSPSR